MSTQFQELFKVEIEGNVGTLESEIQKQTGVESVSTDEDAYMDVGTVVDCEITYDSHETDRTELANSIEAIDGVGSVMFG